MLILRHHSDVCLGLATFCDGQAASFSSPRLRRDRRNISRGSFGTLMEKYAGFSLLREAAMCQHSARARVFSLPTRLSEHSVLQLNYVKIHFDITAAHLWEKWVQACSRQKNNQSFPGPKTGEASTCSVSTTSDRFGLLKLQDLTFNPDDLSGQ